MGNRNYSCGDIVRCSSEGNTRWIVIGNVDSRLVNCVQFEDGLAEKLISANSSETNQLVYGKKWKTLAITTLLPDPIVPLFNKLDKVELNSDGIRVMGIQHTRRKFIVYNIIIGCSENPTVYLCIPIGEEVPLTIVAFTEQCLSRVD